MASVHLREISKQYPNGYRAVKGLNLEIEDGEFLVLVGPSGCGKSTALRMIAGLEDITDGKLVIGERTLNDIEPKDRDIAMVFQNYALYPHMSVKDNIGFALSLRKVPKKEITTRVNHAAEILELSPVLNRKPGQLSGGQRQRVAMGRAIVREPSVFLMDEPLSNLDAKLRVQMRAEIAKIQKSLGITTIYVTHDQVEAMTMADRVAVMKGGHLQQVGSPKELYNSPTNAFVGAFIGSPSMNLFEGTVEVKTHETVLHLGTTELTLSEQTRQIYPNINTYHNSKIVVGFRPEDLEDAAFVDTSENAQGYFESDILLAEELGAETMIHFSLDATPVDVGDPDAVEKVGANGAAVARVDSRTTLTAGTRGKIFINTSRLHLFDASTQQAIKSR